MKNNCDLQQQQHNVHWIKFHLYKPKTGSDRERSGMKPPSFVTDAHNKQQNSHLSKRTDATCNPDSKTAVVLWLKQYFVYPPSFTVAPKQTDYSCGQRRTICTVHKVFPSVNFIRVLKDFLLIASSHRANNMEHDKFEHTTFCLGATLIYRGNTPKFEATNHDKTPNEL